MRYFLILFFLTHSVYADQIKSATLGCPTIEALKNAPVSTPETPMALSMYAIGSGCEIISKRDKVEAIGYDPLNETGRFQKIIYKKTGATLFILRSAISIEQDGKKNGIRF